MKKTIKFLSFLFMSILGMSSQICLAAEEAAEAAAEAGGLTSSHFTAAIIIGLVIGLIVAFSLKGRLKSVRSQYAAANYIVNGSLNLTEEREFFLYKKVEKTKKQTTEANKTN